MSNRVTLDFETAEFGRGGLHPQLPVFRVFAAPTTSTASVRGNAIEPNLFTLACWRMDDARFDFDSSFVRPEAKKEIAVLASIVAESVGHPLTVFGHADPTGSDDYNKALSGRRAQAIFAMLVRDAAMWEDLFSKPFGGDHWGTAQIQTMLEAVSSSSEEASATEAIRTFQQEHGLAADGVAGPQTRKELFLAYMDFLCDGDKLLLSPDDFLGGAEAKGGKGNFQGCSEFNPTLVFSIAEAKQFEQPALHSQRDEENTANRRVVIFFFQKNTRVDDSSWPCPRVAEGTAGCKQRFWSDGEQRRNPQPARRTFEETRDTFGCRFYHRLAVKSPCEGSVTMASFEVRVCDLERDPIPNAPFRILRGVGIRRGRADEQARVFVQALRRPEKIRIEWTLPGRDEDEDFPFSREFFVDVGNDSEADSRRLFNLGYVKPQLADNVRDYQRDFGHPRTGKIDDIRTELRQFHDGGGRPGGRAA